MASRIGNTVISRTANAEWHFYFRAEGTLSGMEVRSNYHFTGTWTLEGGDLCVTFQPPIRWIGNPSCHPVASHQVGDTWTADGVADSLVQGMQ